ncbi:DUF3144 domain-containing protein [Pseudocolwellia agarivorans]|uniref:DUF3144 domain-containing protein n=1 Tax=Pseudocolwellia agarivorans TaxID=1911682 RepID=UPI003F88225D
MDIGEGLEDKFNEVVDDFMQNAIAKESDISIPQVNSSFMYTMACYAARYYAIKSENESVDLESFIKEHTEFFESSIRSGIEYYTTDEENS